MGKRGPRPRNGRPVAVLPDLEPGETRERPPVAWDKLVLKEEQAAEFLKLPRTTFRKKAAAGEFVRYGVTGGTYRYYVYDLMDWLMDRRDAV